LEEVSPRNTSRACHKCGHVSASNRKGLHFCCQKCGHKGDADQEASKNIRTRSVSIACNAAGTGSSKSPENAELLILPLECSVTRHSGCGVGSG
jgi:transposase